MFIYWPDEAYHTPKDTADRISRKNLLETARLTALIALKLSEASIAAITSGAPVSITSAEKAIATETISSSTIMAATAIALVAASGVFYLRRRRKQE